MFVPRFVRLLGWKRRELCHWRAPTCWGHPLCTPLEPWGNNSENVINLPFIPDLLRFRIPYIITFSSLLWLKCYWWTPCMASSSSGSRYRPCAESCCWSKRSWSWGRPRRSYAVDPVSRSAQADDTALCSQSILGHALWWSRHSPYRFHSYEIETV